jgi:hypothetical protein
MYFSARLVAILMVVYSFSANAKTILHIGDSHSAGTFGKELSRLLKSDENITSASYGSCGAVARWYYTGYSTPCGYFQHDQNGVEISQTKHATPKIEEITSAFDADIAIIQLAGNYTGYQDSFIKRDTLKIAQHVIDRGMKCFWVGAPDSRTRRERSAEVKEIIRENIGNICTFIDSTKYTKYPATGGDGIHYYGSVRGPIAKAWAKKVFELVTKE